MSYYNRYWPVIVLTVFAWLTNACAYRFSNASLTPPAGIRSVYIEAVYDTGKEVIPHELLWQAVQREFASNGSVLITSRQDADAIISLEITSSSVTPAGTPNTVDRSTKDPKPAERFGLDPFAYKNLRVAGNYTTYENLSFTVLAKAWDLKNRTEIFAKSYNMGGQFRSVTETKLVQKSTAFLHYGESLEARFDIVSRSIARRIVTDFLSS
jgi:hypothetical protein